MLCVCRWLSSGLSAASTAALASIKQAVSRPPRPVQLTKKDRNNMQGNITRYHRKGNLPEFWSTSWNRHHRVFEPMDKFELVLTSSKNNVWITAINKGRNSRTVFQTHAGNVGIRKAKQKEQEAAYRIGQNAARKLRRLGVSNASVRFRRLMRVDQCLKAFHAEGLNVTSLTHEPRLPFGYSHPPRNRRRV